MSEAWPFYGVFPVRVERLDAYPSGRLIALSDVHGRADLLEKMIAKLALRDEDMLVILGDLIERGPESLRALRMAMRLAVRPNTRVLMGNVDAHRLWELRTDTPLTEEGLLANRVRLGNSLFFDMCREIGLPCDTIERVRAAKRPVREAFAREMAFLAERPTVLDTPDFLFAHGGLPTEDVDSLSGTEAFLCMKRDAFAERGGPFRKRAVVGHWPACLYGKGPVDNRPFLQRERNILSIDGGCGLKPDAQLNAVLLGPEFADGYTHLSVDAFPRVRALDAQRERRQTGRVGWPEGRVRRVGQEGGFALVEQVSTGFQTLAPEVFLSPGPKGLFCSDLTDYAFAVNPGDEIAAVAVGDGRLYGKKDGISGWYAGRWEV